jgi:putative serine protease PepD
MLDHHALPILRSRPSIARPLARPLATAALAFAMLASLTACDASKASSTAGAGADASALAAAASSGAPTATTAAGGSADAAGSAPGGAAAASSGAGSAAPGGGCSSTGGTAGSGDATAPAGGPFALEGTFESVVRNVGPSVVVIETSEGLGSGVVFDDRGDIVTNAHVVGSSTHFTVLNSTGDRLTGTLVGTFPSNDLAVVRASGGTLQKATFGDSTRLAVGQIVLAIGNPLGLQSSVTDGIISALGRTVSEPGGAALPGVIQTSAPINPGNSGGALVNLCGEVIGIPTLTASDPQLGGAAPGIGFAVPSSTAKDIATQLIENGKVVSSHRAYLGIQAVDATGADGVLVYSVQAGGPAAKAGLPADVLITSIAGKPTPDQQTLAAVLAELTPGQDVPVEIERRDGSTETIHVTLGELPG